MKKGQCTIQTTVETRWYVPWYFIYDKASLIVNESSLTWQHFKTSWKFNFITKKLTCHVIGTISVTMMVTLRKFAPVGSHLNSFIVVTNQCDGRFSDLVPFSTFMFFMRLFSQESLRNFSLFWYYKHSENLENTWSSHGVSLSERIWSYWLHRFKSFRHSIQKEVLRLSKTYWCGYLP